MKKTYSRKKRKILILTGQRFIDKKEDYARFMKNEVDVLMLILFKPVRWDCKSKCIIYRDGKLAEEFTIDIVGGKLIERYFIGRVFLYFTRMLITFFLLLKLKMQIKDSSNVIYVTNRFEGLTGIILKKLKLIHFLIYWVGDYYIQSKEELVKTGSRKSYYYVLLIARYIDSWLSIKSDLLWVCGRKMLAIKEAIFKGKTVYFPLGINNSFDYDFNGKPFEILYLGSIDRPKGLELLINCVPEIIKEYPYFKINIVGTGDENYISHLQEVAKNLHIEDHVLFHGVIKTDEELKSIAKKCLAGYALYIPGNNTSTTFIEPGKIKHYLSLGLVVITLKKDIDVMNELEKYNVIYGCEYNKEDLISIVGLVQKLDFKLIKDNIKRCYEDNSYEVVSKRTMRDTFRKLEARFL